MAVEWEETAGGVPFAKLPFQIYMFWSLPGHRCNKRQETKTSKKNLKMFSIQKMVPNTCARFPPRSSFSRLVRPKAEASPAATTPVAKVEKASLYERLKALNPNAPVSAFLWGTPLYRFQPQLKIHGKFMIYSVCCFGIRLVRISSRDLSQGS